MPPDIGPTCIFSFSYCLTVGRVIRHAASGSSCHHHRPRIRHWPVLCALHNQMGTKARPLARTKSFVLILLLPPFLAVWTAFRPRPKSFGSNKGARRGHNETCLVAKSSLQSTLNRSLSQTHTHTHTERDSDRRETNNRQQQLHNFLTQKKSTIRCGCRTRQQSPAVSRLSGGAHEASPPRPHLL